MTAITTPPNSPQVRLPERRYWFSNDGITSFCLPSTVNVLYSELYRINDEIERLQHAMTEEEFMDHWYDLQRAYTDNVDALNDYIYGDGSLHDKMFGIYSATNTERNCIVFVEADEFFQICGVRMTIDPLDGMVINLHAPAGKPILDDDMTIDSLEEDLLTSCVSALRSLARESFASVPIEAEYSYSI